MKPFLPVVALSAFAAVAFAAEKPNIVFVLADDMGYGDIGAYNAESKIATPHLDGLAAGGMRFTDAHSGGSTCVPSRYGLLTGRFAVRADLKLKAKPTIEEARVTIASLLKDSGYATAMVGKWHEGFEMGDGGDFDYSQPLRGGPADRGFDTYFGMHASLDIPPYFYIRGRKPTAAPDKVIEASTSEGGGEGWNRIQGAFWREGPVGKDFKHEEVTPRFAAEAVEVIENHFPVKGKQRKPFFLYLALPSPHTPWLPIEKYRGKSGAGMYGDFVMQVDDVVGEVLAALDRGGLAKDTLLFFSSDNGPVWYDKDAEKFGHDSLGVLRGMKADAWEGGHRVPFLARWPGRIPAGSESGRLICFTDVLATFAELVGAEALPRDAGEDSISFLPGLLDAEAKLPARPPVIHDGNTIRDGDWKLITHLGSGGFSEPKRMQPEKGSKLTGQLYNLRDDLREEKNVYLEHPEIVQRLEKTLERVKRAGRTRE